MNANLPIVICKILPQDSHFPSLYTIQPAMPTLHPQQSKKGVKKRKKKEGALNCTNKCVAPCQICSEIRVLMGFSFNPILSGERSSGEMQDGLSGLLGLSLKLHGLYSPYPMRKYSMGISIACGCSSVTIDPHAWTCQINPTLNVCMHSQFVIYHHIIKTR